MFISALARMSVAWGKDGKLRITPITSGMVALLRVWLAERAGQPAEPLFVTQSGTSLSRDALEHRLAKYIQIATRACPSLGQKTISMHVLRHYVASRPMSHTVTEFCNFSRKLQIVRPKGLARHAT